MPPAINERAGVGAQVSRILFGGSGVQGKHLILLLILMVLLPGMSYGQDYRATVQGIVTDSSQAVIVGATVTLQNDGTGVENVKQTNDSGRYIFNLIEPGTYTVTVEQAGFGKFVQRGVVVQVRGDVTVNASLNPGAVAETVNVAAAVEAVQFNTATMELTVDRKQLEDLPILGRNPFSLAQLNPAVQNLYAYSTPPPYYMWAASTVNIGGHTYRSNEITLDGVSIQVSIKGSYSPPMDAVQEFAVETNSVDAEFGHTAGGILSLGMKSGTNTFHGTASYYGRNPWLNAVQNPITRNPSLVKNHIWGGTFGSPIKKNKLFNFFSYEGWRQSSPGYFSATMPTDAMKSGDFSQARNVAGDLLTIYDPWSTKTASDGTVTRTPFAGNRIPSDRIDPAGQAVMNDLWAPNNAGDDLVGTNNFKKNYGILTHYFNISDRADYYASDKLRTFVRYSMFHTTIDQSEIANSPAVPNGSGGVMNSMNIAADGVYTLNPSTVLDFRFGYAGFRDDYANAPGNIGQSGLAKIWGSNSWYSPYTKNLALVLYPAINLNGTGGSTSLGNEWQWYQRPSHYTYSAKLAKQQGIHSWKAGVEGRYDKAYQSAPDTGNFNFSPALTANTYQNPDTRYSGSQFASLLLGATGGELGNYANWNPAMDMRSHYWGAYAQDDIKLTRRLTINLGLRWEYETALRDMEYKYSRTVDFTTPIPAIAGNPAALPSEATQLREAPPKWTGAWYFTDPQHPYQFDVPKHLFMPKVGLAYRLSDKSALRAGFSRNVVPTTMVSGSLGWIYLQGYSASVSGAPSLQGIPGQQFSDPYPATNPLQMPTGNSLGIYTNQGNLDFKQAYPKELVPQVNDRYNFSYQRELPGRMTFDGTFYIQATRNKPTSMAMNMMDPNLKYTYKEKLDAGVANPFYNYLTPDKFPGSLRYRPTVPLSQLLRPEPAFGDVTLQNVGNRAEFYKALQLRVQRSFSEGASFLFTYYYAKDDEDQYFNDIDQFAKRFTRITAIDNRHRISAAGTYELPFGKGRKMLSQISRIADGFVGGWSLSSIFTYHSGQFLDFTPLGWTPATQVSGDPGSPSRDWKRWFNTSVFAPLPAYTPRTSRWMYEGLTGPRFWNIDTTLAKTFFLTERFNLKFKLEAYNMTNSFIPNDPVVNVYSGAFGVAGTGQYFGNQGRSVQYSLQLFF